MAKGFQGFVLFAPELQGWDGTSTYVRGNFVYADDESLAVNKDIRERPNKITFGRSLKASTRVYGKQAPGGDVNFQFRSDDLPPVLLAHFQKYIGTQYGIAGGSSLFTFVPEKGVPSFSGNSFGTGSYTTAAASIYGMSVVKKFMNTSEDNGRNSQWFNSCIVDELAITLEANDDAKMKASFRASRVDTGTAIASSLDPNSALGSYSTKPSFEHWSGTITWAGTSLDLNKFQLNSKNNLEEYIVIGKVNPVKYKFGRHEVAGSFDLDMPIDGMKYFGSSIGGSSFAVVGTLQNAVNDWVAFNMPNCRFDAIEAQMKGGAAEHAFSLPFKAYESEDGGTAPIIVTVMTTTYGSTPNART